MAETFDGLIERLEEQGWGPLNEASLSRLHAHTQDRSIGIISASRGHLSASENKARTKALGHDLKAAGHGFIKSRGHYIENHGTPHARKVSEHSFIVVGKKGDDNGHVRGTVTKLGAKYNQDSVVYKHHSSETAELHGTQDKDEHGNKVEFPGHGKKVDLGKWHPNRIGEFHSSMKGGKKSFAFESVEINWGANMATLMARALKEKTDGNL